MKHGPQKGRTEGAGCCGGAQVSQQKLAEEQVSRRERVVLSGVFKMFSYDALTHAKRELGEVLKKKKGSGATQQEPQQWGDQEGPLPLKTYCVF